MVVEILAVPEEHLAEVVRVIRSGLETLSHVRKKVTPEVREQLTKWCDEEEEYLNDLKS